MNLILLAVLPLLFWEQGPDTQPLLQKAGVKEIAVPPASAPAWKAVRGIEVKPLDPAQLIRLPAPSLTFQRRMASATRAPWVNSNGWRLLRDAGDKFLYQADGNAVGLAAAESFTFNVESAIRTDAAGLTSFANTLSFLASLPQERQNLPPRVNIGYIDDGSPQSGEFMNMLVRRNLLFRVVKTPDPSLDLTVSLNDPDYPRAELANPKLVAEKVRANLGDEKRILRIYGSEIVIGRVLGNTSQARAFLLNYGAARQPVNGLHVRVRGPYRTIHAYAEGVPDCHPQDVKADSEAIEFTLDRLNTIAVIDLDR